MTTIGDEATLAQRVAAYLRQETGRDIRVGTVRRFAVGFSWLTYLVPVTGLGDTAPHKN